MFRKLRNANKNAKSNQKMVNLKKKILIYDEKKNNLFDYNDFLDWVILNIKIKIQALLNINYF